MKYWMLLLFVPFVMAACNNAGIHEGKEEPVQEEMNTGTEESNFTRAFPHLFTYFRQQDASFREDSFEIYGENKLDTLPAAGLEDSRVQPFKQLFIYNNDSSLAIDLYSYNYIIRQQNGQQQIEAAGPDTEIGLVDVKANTRSRLFFSGPSTVVYDAQWMDDETVLLAGAETTENNGITPAIWKINVSRFIIQSYVHKHSIKADMNAYMENKTAALQKR